jgi:ubiquinone/menaquinone biosynthesis C-methylase UbiE
VLFAGARGRILDAGVGTGRNMPYYPAGGAVTGIDLSAPMLSRAKWRREKMGAEVVLRAMDVKKTDFPDGHFDTIAATFLFCVLDQADQLPALRELCRISKDGGEIRILEYAYSSNRARRLMMRLWSPWVALMYGAAFDRNTKSYVSAAGLRLVERRFLYKDIIKLLVLRPR